MPENKPKLVAKIVRLDHSFDGIKVQVGDCVGVQGPLERTRAFEVTGVQDTMGNIHPIPAGALWVHEQYLEVLPDSVKDAYGKFDFELRYEKQPISIVLVQYENVLCVSVVEKLPGLGGTHTLYTQNYSKDFDAIKRAVEAEIMTGDSDDLIFKLKEIKDSHNG